MAIGANVDPVAPWSLSGCMTKARRKGPRP